MKKFLIILLFIPCLLFSKEQYKITFEEYKLANGLHVILHQDNSAPNAVVGVKYHVGSKNEESDRTGFAHFFEHLLFHGTKNIPQGELENIIMSAGGYANAYTSYDVTYYYQLLPAHEYKLGLWIESERMLHPVITQEGIDREREIVKEEKRMRYDNKPLGNSYNNTMESMYNPNTYGHSMIGSMEHLDASSLSDFTGFFKTYYVPNNACLVLAGNIDIQEAKKWINYYFDDIPKGKEIERPAGFGQSTNKEKRIEKHVKGIKNTAISIGYYGAPQTEEDAIVLNTICGMLSSNGDKSHLTNLAKKDSMIYSLSASAELWEGVGFVRILAKLNGKNSEEQFFTKLEEQLNKLKHGIFNDSDLQMFQNAYESGYTDLYYDSESIADNLTNFHHIYGNSQLFNTVIDKYQSITKEDVMRVAKKYLDSSNRVVIIYYPEK